MFGNQKYIVKKKALITSNIITNGAPSKTSKKTILETKSENGWNALSIFWSKPNSPVSEELAKAKDGM